MGKNYPPPRNSMTTAASVIVIGHWGGALKNSKPITALPI